MYFCFIVSFTSFAFILFAGARLMISKDVPVTNSADAFLISGGAFILSTILGFSIKNFLNKFNN
jgi:hypothetical protein